MGWVTKECQLIVWQGRMFFLSSSVYRPALHPTQSSVW